MTMYALLVVKDVSQLADCMHGTGDDGRHVGPKAFQDTLKRAGITPSYGHACLFPIQGNLVLLMANHEYGINATDATQVTEATLRARGEIHQIVRGLRKLGGPWDGLQVAAPAADTATAPAHSANRTHRPGKPRTFDLPLPAAATTPQEIDVLQPCIPPYIGSSCGHPRADRCS